MGKKNKEKDRGNVKLKKKKRSSSSSSGDSSNSLSSIDEKIKRKLKKKIKKLRKKQKIKKKEKKALKKLLKSKIKDDVLQTSEVPRASTSCDVDVSLMEKSNRLAPMTKEEWEKQQNTLKRVYDEKTGRIRLIKGSGEIVEECVKKINGKDKVMEADVVEEFYGVYLLKCLNPDYKGRTYIGYTIDPNRRIKQHNKGKIFGGAWKTSKKGPWEMTLTVHGFPSDVAALRFEWAWQHPKRSRRLKSVVPNKKASETSHDYCIKIMFIMLRTPPWCRLPLTIRWLSADVLVDPPPNFTPPVHMPIVFGPVVCKKLKSPMKNTKYEDVVEELHFCRLCLDFIKEKELLVCLNSSCHARWHIVCLAKHFISNENSLLKDEAKGLETIIPVEGCCIDCSCTMLWGDLIRKKMGCYNISLQKADESVINDSG